MLFETGRTVVVDGVLFFVIIGAPAPPAARRRRRGPTTPARRRGRRSARCGPIPRELRAAARGPLRRRRRSASLVVGAAAARAAAACGPSQRQPARRRADLRHRHRVARGPHRLGGPDQPRPRSPSSPSAPPSPASLAQQGKDFFVCLLVAGLVGAARRGASSASPRCASRACSSPSRRWPSRWPRARTSSTSEFFPWLVPDPSVRDRCGPCSSTSSTSRREHTFYYVVLVAVRARRWRRCGRCAAVAHGPGPGRHPRQRARRAGLRHQPDPGPARPPSRFSGFIAALAGGAVRVPPARRQRHGPRPRRSTSRCFSHGVIGGLGSVPGALLGAGLPHVRRLLAVHARAAVSRLLRQRRRRARSSCWSFPAGLGGLLYDVRDALLRRIARRRGIVVPSLAGRRARRRRRTTVARRGRADRRAVAGDARSVAAAGRCRATR